MRCPNCGSPVMVYANRWECGYCGDCGVLRTRKTVPEPAQMQHATLTVKFINKLDFDAAWSKMKESLSQRAEKLVSPSGAMY